METYWDKYLRLQKDSYFINNSIAIILEDFWMFCNKNDVWIIRHNPENIDKNNNTKNEKV